MATAAPRASDRNAAITTSPEGAKVMAASSSTGGLSVYPPAQEAPRSRADELDDPAGAWASVSTVRSGTGARTRAAESFKAEKGGPGRAAA